MVFLINMFGCCISTKVIVRIDSKGVFCIFCSYMGGFLSESMTLVGLILFFAVLGPASFHFTNHSLHLD